MAKAEIEVPEGMTAEKLIELVTSYEEKRVKGKARQDARKKAVTTLKEKYASEYENLVKSFMPKGA